MTCEKCGYIPWPGEKGCSSCKEIEDKKWEAAAPKEIANADVRSRRNDQAR